MTSENTNHAGVSNVASRRLRRLWLGVMVAAMGTVAASAAHAHGNGPWGRHGGEPGDFMAHRVQRVLEKVGASDAQKAQIKATWDGLRPELAALHQQKAQLRQQIAEAAAAPTIDTARVEQLRQQSVQLMDKRSVVFTRGLVATAQALTPEQRKQVLAVMEKHHHGRGAKPGDQGGR